MPEANHDFATAGGHPRRPRRALARGSALA